VVLVLGASLASCGTTHPPAADAATVFGPRTAATCPSPAVTYAAFGRSFFATYCTACHASTLTGAARLGAPEGYDFDTITGVRAFIPQIDEVAASGPGATNTTMPFAGPQPSLAEREQLGQLLACGVPD
jgi:cytochrome c5